jgi:hypothetical protein
MAYRVSLAAPAEAAAYAVFERVRDAAPTHAEKWLKFIQGHFHPDELPVRCPSFPRRKSLAFPPATCCTAKGRAFTESSFISADERHVRVLRMWHASRDAITATNVEG